MIEARCESDPDWFYSSTKRTNILSEIIKKHESELIPDGSGVKGNMQHLHSSFIVIEENGDESHVRAQDGRIWYDEGSESHHRPLRTDNSISE